MNCWISRNSEASSTMDLYSFFVDDDDEFPLYYTPLPYGSPGVDALLSGRNELTRFDDQWTPNDPSTTLWQQTQEQSHRSEFNDAAVFRSQTSFSPIETDSCLLNSPHGFWDFEFSSTFWKELWTEDALNYSPSLLDVNCSQAPDRIPENADNHLRQQSLERVATVDDDTCCDQYIAEIPKNAEERGVDVKKKRSRPSAGVQKSRRRKLKSKKGHEMPKGLTVCLRTLLRQLLAGTGWVIDPCIGRDEACSLIKLLIGSELEDQLQIDPPKIREEDLFTEWRQEHYNAVLADIMTYMTGTKIEIGDLDGYITLRRGPYRLSSSFRALLKGRTWPPCLPTEECLRSFQCYRQGEASPKRSNVEQCPEDAFDLDV